jgi:hypothetical protein
MKEKLEAIGKQLSEFLTNYGQELQRLELYRDLSDAEDAIDTVVASLDEALS